MENPKSVYGSDEKTPQTRMAIAALIRKFKKAQEYLEEVERCELEEDDESKQNTILSMKV